MQKGKAMQLEARLKASGFSNRLRAGHADTSQATRPRPLAQRTVLGRRVLFYDNGEHSFLDQSTLSPEEQYSSELLRFCHASLVAGQPIGDKSVLWVDAATNPVEVHICGLEANQYLAQVHTAINIGLVPGEMVLDRDDNTVPTLKEIQWQT